MAVGYSPEQRTKNGGLWTVRNLQCPGRNPQSWAWRSGSCSHPCAPSSSAPATPCTSHTPSQPSAWVQSHNTVTVAQQKNKIKIKITGSNAGEREREREREMEIFTESWPCSLVGSCESELSWWSCLPSSMLTRERSWRVIMTETGVVTSFYTTKLSRYYWTRCS